MIRGRHTAACAFLYAAAALIPVGCGDGATRDAQDLTLPQPRLLEVPAGAGAAQPFLATGPAGVIVSWTEPAADGHALRFAEWDGSGWSAARTVATGSNWFVNWADFPSVVALDDDVWAAHWLQRSGPGRYSYDVVLTTSADRGVTWSTPVRPHRDGTETEHGFVSIFRHGQGAGVVWLDGRRYEETPAGPATNEMQLRFTTVQHGEAGTEAGAEVLLDDRICDCCQTAVAVTGRGPVAFYRDRLPGEVRDISVTRLLAGEWTAPQRVHDDGWVINACPVNGPAADAHGDDVVVAWYSGANETPRVHVAFSRDAGATFAPPVVVDDGHPIGRVDVLFLEDRRALVVWIERAGEDAGIRGRIVAPDGAAGPSLTLAATISGRAGGFPRMARRGPDVVLAWTEPGETSRIRAAVLPLSDR
jgi:hypothetical protein